MTEDEYEKIRLTQKEILEDKQLQQLHAKRVKIYSLVTPTVILKDGKAEIVWIDEINHHELLKINEMINFRIEQIKQFYLKPTKP